MVQAVLAGLTVQAIAGLVAAGIVGLGACYLLIPHVTSRIDRFLTGGGDTYQIDRALVALRAGGLLGAGPREGALKLKLQDPHTDYSFAVIRSEERRVGKECGNTSRSRQSPAH